jgi:hypothetical protein
MKAKQDEFGMIYIEENSFERQIDLISSLASQAPFDLVAWLYPESTINNIIGTSVSKSITVNAMPVTTYGDGFVASCTQRLRVTDLLINMIMEEKKLITENCDSLCIYSHESPEWQACTIGHEGMILVRDTSLLGDLKSLGFNASLHAPSWW